MDIRWQSSEVYLRNSPLAHADRIRSPILLINSDMDGFAMGEYDAMFVALRRLNRRVDYLSYWGRTNQTVNRCFPMRLDLRSASSQRLT